MKRSLDRARIERHLHADEQVSVAEWCDRRGVPLDAWPQHTGALGWLDLAVSRALDKAIQTGRARSRSKALQLVCGDFGLCGESVRRRWARTHHWRKHLRTAPEIGDETSHNAFTDARKLSA